MAFKNLIQLFDASAQKYKGSDCFIVRSGDEWVSWGWTEVYDKVRSLSVALQGLGVGLGDKLAILSSTRAEWTLADLAILSVGAITVPIYHSNLAEEIEFILANSEAKGIFVEDQDLLGKLLKVKQRLPNLQFVVLMEGSRASGGALLMNTLLKESPDKASAYQKNLKELGRDTLASFVYTSGTTGTPKGAILTHGNFLAEVEACMSVIKVKENDVTLSFLPLAHILARAMQFYQIGTGVACAYAESIEKLADNLQEIRPHFLVSVPRIFEKVYERIISQVHSSSAIKQKLFHWASRVGAAFSQAKQRGESPPVFISLQYLLASRLVFSKIRDRLGGQIRFAISGGAPLSKDIAEFFHAAGILILEGYGLTETSGAINCVRMDRIEFGGVGAPLPGIEQKIADDGEIMVRGKMVFQGYYRNEEATREVLDAKGWFHTGDIGKFTESGSLRITDRKKDIIVTAGGKNIAPQKIENMLKVNKYISQVVVHGDKRKYLTALVTLNLEELEKYAEQKKFSGNGDVLTQHPKVYDLVKKIIDQNNASLAKYETIKKFAILKDDLTQEANELTPTLKVRRRFVYEKYADVIQQLYDESGN